MVVITGVLKRHKNVFGILIPKEVAERENIKENQRIDIIILKNKEFETMDNVEFVK